MAKALTFDGGWPIKLYLLRHGESESNARRLFAVRAFDPPLTDDGADQAKRQALALSAAGLSAIYTSPLLRARQTASFVGDLVGLPVVQTAALTEVDLGDLDGRAIDAGNLATYRTVIGEWEGGALDARFPGGESLVGVVARFRRFLDELRYPAGGAVLAVGHGILFMAVLWALCENANAKMLENYMGRGHLSVISGKGDRLSILEFNVAPPDISATGELP